MSRYHWHRAFRLRHWLALLLSCLVALSSAGLLPGMAAATAAAQRQGTAPAPRKVPGDSPRKTVENFLILTGNAETVIRQALAAGMTEPGLTFSPAVIEQAQAAAIDLQRATQAMDLSKMPISLRPMSGVGTMLMLRSLLLYDLHQRPDFIIPDHKQVAEQRLQSWTIPDTPITLRKINANDKTTHQACSQCSHGDFLFSADTLIQVPNDFEDIFEDKQTPDRRFGADLYTLWALLPGGVLPPKIFLLLPLHLRSQLLAVYAGQSLLQWLLLIPVTLAVMAAIAWWLWRIRRWQKQHEDREGPIPSLIETAAVVPLIALIFGWEWYAIDWINLFGERQEAILFISRLIHGLLQALLVYLLAETIGQLISIRSESLPQLLKIARPERRQGSGQILTIARCIGLIGAIIVSIQTGRDLGLTSVTLFALSSVPALAISLGTQQLIRDIADGFSLLLDGQIKPGDHCSIGKGDDIKGTIQSLGMRSVRLQKDDGSILAIPNSEVASAVVVNHNRNASKRCELTLALEPEQRSLLPQLLSEARDLLAHQSNLLQANLTIKSHDQGLSLVVRGEWRDDLSSHERKTRQEELLLQLLLLLNSQTAAPPPGEQPA